MKRLNGSVVIDTEDAHVSATSYLDEAGELPDDRLELYFLLRRAMRHVVEISASTVMSSEGVRDGAIILARCLRRASFIAQALADREARANVSQPLNGKQEL